MSWINNHKKETSVIHKTSSLEQFADIHCSHYIYASCCVQVQPFSFSRPPEPRRNAWHIGGTLCVIVKHMMN